MNYKQQLQLMFKYQDKINKAKKYRKKFLNRMDTKDICFFSCEANRRNLYVACCDQTEKENEMCYGCKVLNFYRLYIRKYSALKRSILMKLRHEVNKVMYKF